MDFQILYMLQSLHNPVLDVIMVGFTTLGDAGIVWLTFGALMMLTRKHRFFGFRLFVVMGLCLIFGCFGLKNLVARPRPCWIDHSVRMLIEIPKDYSFPSGHSMSSFAAAHIIYRYKHRWGLFAFILAACIALSRMYLFVHFPTDIIAGMILGILFGMLTNTLLIRFYEFLHNII